jgi:hypothetical protein
MYVPLSETSIQTLIIYSDFEQKCGSTFNTSMQIHMLCYQWNNSYVTHTIYWQQWNNSYVTHTIYWQQWNNSYVTHTIYWQQWNNSYITHTIYWQQWNNSYVTHTIYWQSDNNWMYNMLTLQQWTIRVLTWF